MKYLVLSFNDVDSDWRFHGMKDTYPEAVDHVAKTDWPDNPTGLQFHERDDMLSGVYSAWSGHDHYFIFPVVTDVRD